MTAEREFVWFALPFAAGVLAAAYLSGTFSSCTTAGASLSGLATALALACLMLCRHYHLSDIRITASTAAAALFCGLSACFTATEISVWNPLSLDRLKDIGRAFADAIGSVPFSDERTKALLKALITGIKDDVPKEVIAAFRSSGASHILALSGFHLGIIYSVAKAILIPVGHKRIRSVLILLLCGGYTLITGACPSITRAFLFIFLHETASLTGRKTHPAQIFMTALVLQLIISPMSAKDVGFQLSYAAMAGIIFIFPHLRALWPENSRKGIMKRIWNSAALSISCQISTGPLVWVYFNSFPVNFLLTNLIAVPLTGIIIPAALAVTAAFHSGICPESAVKLTEFLVRMLYRSLEIISAM